MISYNECVFCLPFSLAIASELVVSQIVFAFFLSHLFRIVHFYYRLLNKFAPAKMHTECIIASRIRNVFEFQEFISLCDFFLILLHVFHVCSSANWIIFFIHLILTEWMQLEEQHWNKRILFFFSMSIIKLTHVDMQSLHKNPNIKNPIFLFL